MNHVITRTDLLQSFERLKTQFSQALGDAQAKDQEFEKLRQNFHSNLTRRLIDAQKRLPEKNPLAQQISHFMDLLRQTNDEWDKKIAGRDKGVQFRAGFNDSLLVFVYGKVKSGKSSLGNYVAWGHTDPTDTLKQAVQAALQPHYFSHERTDVASGDAHKEAETKKEFRVGATEATSSIQGFRLSGLTWVDSPGLHSVNEENGQLARDYVEHADLILYTMKSDAPGRETDLAEIRDLFGKDKKTVLLLTGSDTTEEDEDENGKIVKMTVMKSAETRAKQREYVQQALANQNLANKNLDVISFSARYAQENEHKPEQFQDSGMGQFFAVLSELIHAEGVAMKQRVPMSNFKNFMADCVRDIEPYRALLSNFEKTVEQLQQKLPRTVSVAQSQADLAMRQAVNREFDHVAQLDDGSKKSGIQAAQKSLNQECQKIVSRHLEQVFVEIMSDFQQSISHDFVSSDMVKLPEFAVEMQERQVADEGDVRKGTRTRNSGVGSVVGMGVGAAIGGPVGAIIGGFVGGLLGRASGRDAEIDYKTVSLPVADNFQDIRHTALTAYTDAVQKQMNQNADKLMNQVLQEAKKLLQDLSDEVQSMAYNLQNLHHDVETSLAK